MMQGFKQYILRHYITTIVSFLFFFAIFMIDDCQQPLLYLILFIAAQIEGYYRHRKQQSRELELKSKGLIPEDEANIAFVKKWEETRAGGMWKYCIIDGGLITGAGIAFGLCFLVPIVVGTERAFAGPGTMFAIIGWCYLAGIAIGATLFRLLWPRKERRFKNLTQFPFGITYQEPVKELR